MGISCKAFILGDNVSTDLIHPPDAFGSDPDRLAAGFLRGVCPDWAGEETAGAIVVAGRNFGCGSSREVAASVFLGRGIRLVLAMSFARIFLRNLVNLGLPVGFIQGRPPWPAGSQLQLELDQAGRRLSGQGACIEYLPPAPFLERIIEAGGLLGLLDDPEAGRG